MKEVLDTFKTFRKSLYKMLLPSDNFLEFKRLVGDFANTINSTENKLLDMSSDQEVDLRAEDIFHNSPDLFRDFLVKM